jgi:hypothetical protein
MEETTIQSLIFNRPITIIIDIDIINELFIIQLNNMTKEISEKYKYLIENKKYIHQSIVPSNQWNFREKLKIGIILWKKDRELNKQQLEQNIYPLNLYKYYNLTITPSIDGITGWITIIIEINFFNLHDENNRKNILQFLLKMRNFEESKALQWMDFIMESELKEFDHILRINEEKDRKFDIITLTKRDDMIYIKNERQNSFFTFV